MKHIAIYSRKSKDTDKGESINNQIKMCKDYFLRCNEECTFEIFQDEGFSGKSTDRPSFLRMMALAKRKQFDIIACYKIDRIARNIIDFMNTFDTLQKSNVSLVSITENFDASTPMGMMMMTILAGFAQMERMNIAERVKDNMLSLAQLGRWSGGTTPTGYKAVRLPNGDKTAMYLELLPEWKDTIKKIFTCLANEYTGTYTAKLLDMPQKTITNIISNPVYCKSDELSKTYLENLGYQVFGELNGNGYLPYNRRPRTPSGKKLFNAKGMFAAVSRHEGVIDSAIWIKANEELKKRGKEANPRISKFSFLAHLVKCKCGAGMTINPGHRRKNGERTYYFMCSRQKYNRNSSCDTGWIRSDYLEADIIEILTAASKDIEILKKHINKGIDKNIIDEIKKLKKIIEKNNKKINNLSENLSFLIGSAAKPTIEQINKIANENDKLNYELLQLEYENSIDDEKENSYENLQNNIKILLSKWNNFDMENKQIEIRGVIKEIKWDGDKHFKIIPNL